ncbi:glycoside hydrolase family 172 protein [Paenibacillus spongiae]|uniref:DUF2961 domain-containing protein n=1 Tax=Paenibacillus spongiae TaxID=2909671 RepID=A0ABY5SIW5_9BACL|nr:glycoside hydrolase family 172 protein [Paenibacillus spongiae]UVI33380.1 DUF2961 domain-containing protein [Paenibacillus spongiae]
MRGLLSGISKQGSGIRTRRISSYDRTGGNRDCIRIEPGETAVIADMKGSGIVRHIWITFRSEDPFMRRNSIIRMYWDGERHPSVEAPLGDFFGQGWGEEYSFLSLPIAAAPKQGRALNCYFPMPFQEGARITIENESEAAFSSFYYYIDYEEHDSIPDDEARFHAWWNREQTEAHPAEGETEWGVVAPQGNNLSVLNNYLFADIAGKGHFVGLQYFVDNPGPMWYGEGDDMWLIDGESWPGSLHGTGTEDFFNSSWCPNELYQHPYFGYARIPDKLGWMGRTHCYRFFLEDPVYFEKSLHASIEHGHDNNLALDLCTVAYWYQTEPHRIFPPFPSKFLRENRPEITVRDVHRWRHEWRRSMGGSPLLWGNEIK